MKNVPSVRVSATFVAEPVEAALRYWLPAIGLDTRVEFAPYNQVFQELLDPTSPAAQVRGANLVFIRLEDWLREQQSHAAGPTTPAAAPSATHARHRLPNGIEVAELNRPETDHLYREIFQNRAYLRHGIHIEDSAVIVDCGANIGMFSLFAHLHARDVRILAVEPGPTTASVLRTNAALHGVDMTVVDAGLSDRDGEASFTFYENYSLVSGFDAGREEDATFLRAAIRSTLEAESRHNTDSGVVETLTDYLVTERLQQKQIVRPIRRLGGVLREHGIGRIDLLKIDVEKAELQVLAGLDADQWSAIQQIVMEIHDRGDAIETTTTDLQRRGFRVTLEEERDLKNTGVWNLFAVRPEYEAEVRARQERRAQDILRNVTDLGGAATGFASRSSSLLTLVVCPPSLPATARAGYHELQAQAVRVLREQTAGVSNVMVVDASSAAADYACENYYDGRADQLGHMPYSADGYAVIGTVAARALHAWARPTPKVVVVDCDNTLWSGVCGEDGAAGVTFGPAHRQLCARLTSLQQAGVLLALNSKNEAGDVWAVFDGRPDFGLRRDQFVASRLNWQPKSQNLREIAAELNLGLDSFVFIDDNPVECAEVAAHAPEVTVLQWPTEPDRAIRFLEHLWALDTGPTTDEDRKRTRMYQQEAARRQLRDSSASMDAFLAGLELEVAITPVAPQQVPRAAQLTERTNQFNFTTIRRGEDDIRRLIADGADVRILHVRDRFGDYGLVGLSIGSPDNARRALVVDTFLMSCRVLGKGVEHRLLAELGRVAMAAGLEFVELSFRPTTRNRPAWMFASTVFESAAALDAGAPQTFRIAASDAASVTFRPGAGTEVIEEDGDGAVALAPAAFRPDYQRIAGGLDTAAGIAAAVFPVSASSSAGATSYEPPSSDVEQSLARIWAELLHLDRVGIQDNFFALGGDSIIGIQVLSRAAQAGLRLEMKDLFEHETIAALARIVETRQVAVGAEANTPIGTGVALTPIQHWFFEKALPVFDHWNMEMVLRAEEPVDAARLVRSLDALVDHHEALRYRYSREDSRWVQRVGEAPRVEILETIDVPSDPAAKRAAMAGVAARLHATLNLADGPLLRVALCRPVDGGNPEVVLVLHHLVSDGITWRVVLEDLDTAYGQLTAGLPVALPMRRTTYAAWAEKLAAYAGGAEVASEMPHWRAVAAGGPTPIACDHPGASAEATERTLTVTPSVFSADETRTLLQQAPQAFDTQVNDVLLAALAVAYRETFGTSSLLVDLEGHGREPLFDGVDLSRTVGWFTTVFPVRIDACGSDLAEAIASARAVRRAIPKRGIGYGVLRYMHPEAVVRETLAEAPRPEVMFNYLGQFDQALGSSSRFSLSPDLDFGPLHGPDGLRSHLFEIIGRVVGGQLRLDWMYSTALFDAATVARLIANYERAIRGILRIAGDTRPAASVSPRAAALEARFGRERIEEVHGLAPIQQLFLVALDAGQTVGLDQWRCQLQGAVDVAAFRQAWDHVVSRHGVMRTAFVSDAPGGAAQVVLRDGRMAWHDENLEGRSDADRAAHIAAFVEADRRRGFDPVDPPLMRIAMFQIGPSRWEMIWTFHHLLIDGWSCPLVFAAVGEAYDAIVGGQPLPRNGSTYGGYVRWLERHPASRSEPFWRRYLEGFTTPATLPKAAGASPEVIEHAVTLSAPETSAIHDVARRWRVSLNTLLQLAWALVLSRQTGRTDVVFGVAFSGRPADLPDVESVIGPFVNNLPIRVAVDGERTLESVARGLQNAQFDLLPHQTTPLPDVQRWSDVGPGQRLFESLLVLQSYVTAAGLRALGSRVSVTRVEAPVRTNYPLTVIAVPADGLVLRLIANPGTFALAQVERLAADFAEAVRSFASAAASVSAASERLSVPSAAPVVHTPRVRSADPVPARPGLESTLAAIWQRAFGLDDIGVNETFADLGGQSLLMLHIHGEIERALGKPVSIVALFQHPTIRGLASFLEGSTSSTDRASAVKSRAAKQAEALARQAGRRRT